MPPIDRRLQWDIFASCLTCGQTITKDREHRSPWRHLNQAAKCDKINVIVVPCKYCGRTAVEDPISGVWIHTTGNPDPRCFPDQDDPPRATPYDASIEWEEELDRHAADLRGLLDD